MQKQRRRPEEELDRETLREAIDMALKVSPLDGFQVVATTEHGVGRIVPLVEKDRGGS